MSIDKSRLQSVGFATVPVVGIGLILFVAVNATSVFATEGVRGPMVVQLADQTCEFVPRGKSRSTKRVRAGASPIRVLVTHKRVWEKERFLIRVWFGVSPRATSEELCRYVAYQTVYKHAGQELRGVAVKILAKLTAVELMRFQNTKSELEQAAFTGYLRALFAEHTHERGLTVTRAYFDRYTK